MGTSEGAERVAKMKRAEGFAAICVLCDALRADEVRPSIRRILDLASKSAMPARIDVKSVRKYLAWYVWMINSNESRCIKLPTLVADIDARITVSLFRALILDRAS